MEVEVDTVVVAEDMIEIVNNLEVQIVQIDTVAVDDIVADIVEVDNYYYYYYYYNLDDTVMVDDKLNFCFFLLYLFLLALCFFLYIKFI